MFCNLLESYSGGITPPTNEILVRLAGEKATLIGFKPTEVLFPAMANRVFGIDMGDELRTQRQQKVAGTN